MPCSKSVSCGLSLSRSDTWPNSVSLPVRITTALPLPLTTWVRSTGSLSADPVVSLLTRPPPLFLRGKFHPSGLLHQRRDLWIPESDNLRGRYLRRSERRYHRGQFLRPEFLCIRHHEATPLQFARWPAASPLRWLRRAPAKTRAGRLREQW